MKQSGGCLVERHPNVFLLTKPSAVCRTFGCGHSYLEHLYPLALGNCIECDCDGFRYQAFPAIRNIGIVLRANSRQKGRAFRIHWAEWKRTNLHGQRR